METVTTLQEDTIAKLQDLIEICIDSAKGCADAAEHSDDEQVSSLFRQLGNQRADHTRELQGYVKLNREKPEKGGSALGTAHRLWLDLRAAINGGDPKVILIEAERGEDQIKQKYEEVIKETAGSALNDVLLRQYKQVKDGHDRVRDLRDTYVENKS
jgi:uncharacterized protein (TIGR02284 family)